MLKQKQITIDLRNISKIYQLGETSVKALDNVSLTIQSGEFVAITGASGSGKSTLLHVIGCLDVPTRGTYLLDGEDVTTHTKATLAELRNKKIGFVFQQFHLLPHFTATQNVALPQLYAKIPHKQAYKQAIEALSLVGLQERCDHHPAQLSGGEQQRVAIARALVNDPNIILADEPTGNLDTVTGHTIINLLETLNKKMGRCIVMVTHEPNIAAHASRVLSMRDGKVVEDKKLS